MKEETKNKLIEIHDLLLVYGGYPNDYPVGALMGHIRRLQRELSDVICEIEKGE